MSTGSGLRARGCRWECAGDRQRGRVFAVDIAVFVRRSFYRISGLKWDQLDSGPVASFRGHFELRRASERGSNVDTVIEGAFFRELRLYRVTSTPKLQCCDWV